MSGVETQSLLRVGIEHELGERAAEAEKIYRRLRIEMPRQPDVPNLLGLKCAKSDRMERRFASFSIRCKG